jgi:phenylpyruvate tautomerase PptA (4-oxalocrotonate tautomerase family)
VGQVKIYGLRSHLTTEFKPQLSDVIHRCVVEALRFPADKRAHRFFPLEAEDFYYPEGRSSRYTIVEIYLMEGRAVETKKNLIQLLFDRTQQELGFVATDLEVMIIESPKYHWGFRGQTGDEIILNYNVDV